MKIKNLQQKNGIIASESKGSYSYEDSVKFLTKSIESSLCDYSDAYILVTEDITATPNNAAAQVTLKLAHHLKIAEQKLMILLLIMQILLILQCLCII